MMPDVTLTIKTVVLASPGINSLEILRSSADGGFPSAQLLRLGMEPVSKYQTIQNQKICFSLWIVSATDEFSRMQSIYFMGSMALILMFKLEDRSSLEIIPIWAETVKEFSPNVAIVVVGILPDDPNNCIIKEQEIMKIITEIDGFLYIETKFQDKTTLETMFEELGKLIRKMNSAGAQIYRETIESNGIKVFRQ